MRERLVDRIPFAKIVIGLVVAFLVSLGLCGLTLAFSGGGGGNSAFANLGILELVAMAASAAGAFLTVVVWAILSIVGSFGEKVSQPQKLFDEQDDTKLDKQD
jgi:ABC-type molybdate transport system permease subunit